MKKCFACGIEKKEEKFWKSKNHKCGLHPSCIECMKENRKKHAEKHREKNNERAKKHYEENREKKLQYAERYREENAHKVKASQLRTYYSRSEDKIEKKREISRNYIKTEKYKQWHEKYKQKIRDKLKCRSVLNNAVRDGILERPSHCQVCNQEKLLDGHHSDYSKPLQVLWVCRKCHVAIHKLLKEP
jgi:hypothetical protein